MDKNPLLQLPEEVTLLGIPIKIIVDDTMIEKHSFIGRADYINQTIIIDTTAPKETVEQALIHELCHYIMHFMGEEELRDNEKFVDMLAHLIYQALASIR